jgi:hypothetical protein
LKSYRTLLLLLTLAGCSARPLPPPLLPTRIVDQDVSPEDAYARARETLSLMQGELLYTDVATGLLLAQVRGAVLYVKVMPWNDGTCGVYVRGRGRGDSVEAYANRLQGRPMP